MNFSIKNTTQQNKTTMKKNLITSLILLVSTLGFAQKTTIKGHVLNSETGTHVPFINVVIDGTTIGTTTDATGHFTITDDITGKQTIKVQGIGYNPSAKEVELTEGKTAEVNFEIKEDAVNLNDVVISSNRNEVNRKDASIVVSVLSDQLFETTQSKCLAQSLSFQPGLRTENDCQNCGFTQVRINGLEGPYSQILIDSRPIFSALNGVYGLEQIPVNMVERVEVVRGGGSALYGSNAIAGTINIITKEPNYNSFSAGYDYEAIGEEASDNNFNVNTSIVSDDRKSGMNLYGAYRNRQAYDADGDSFSEIPELTNHTLGFNSYYKLNKQTKLKFEYHNIHEYRRGGDSLSLQPHEANIAEMVEHDINGGGMSLDWISPDKKNKLNVYASAQYTNRDSYYGAGQDPNAYGFTKDLTHVEGVQFVHSFDKLFFMPSDLTMGGEFHYDDLNDVQKAYDRDFEQTTQVGGAFIQNEWFTDKFRILVGGRVDKHNLLDDAIFSPRGNIKYNILDNLHWRASYSTGFRAPQAFDEDLHIGAVNGEVHLIELADDLEAEKSQSISSSFDYYLNFGKVKTNFLVEGFYTTIDNVFALEETGTDANGNSILTRTNAPGATVKGINLEGKIVPSSKVRLQLGYTIQSSEYNEAQAWSDDENVALTTKMARTPEQYGYFTLTVEPLRRLTISATGTYTGSMLVPHYAGYIAEDTMEKSPEFFDAGLKAAYIFKLNNNLGLELSGGVKNLFDQYQSDFDQGMDRDAGYIYGPALPRSFFVSLKLSNLLDF